MARSQVPKFGNWESEEVPYTIYFDNARKGKKSCQTNHIDPRDNIEGESKDHKASEANIPKHDQQYNSEEGELRKSSISPGHKPAAIDPSHKRHNNYPRSGSDKSEVEASKASPEMFKPKHERRPTREEGDLKRFIDSPSRYEAATRRNSSNSPRMVNNRQSVGSDRSVDHSPMHPHSQSRVGVKNSGISSPSWERKVTSDAVPLTPGRSRLRSVTRGDDSLNRSPAVPKFGEWDESDPASAEGYTQIFNKVREEKHSDTGKVPTMPAEASSLPNGQKHYGNDNPKGCGCFPWARR